MFKGLPRARFTYLAVIFILFAVALSFGARRLLQQEQRAPTADVAEPTATPQAETEAQGEKLNQVQLAQVEQAQADAAGLEFDHHGNPIRPDPAYERVVANGASVEFTVENFLGVGGRGGELAPEIFEGELAVLKFRIAEEESSQALADLRPAVWMNLTDETAHAEEADHSQEACQEKVAGYLGGTLAARPDINLNSYFVLAMNDHASISVIDPMIDVAGMTNLFSAIQLPKPGADWAMSADQQHLFVTIPAADQITVADLEQFWAIKNLNGGVNPVRIVFQPDQTYLWVGNDAEGEQSGVTVLDPKALTTVTFIPTGAGHHELAFSADSRYAFVTNGADSSLSVIDTTTLRKVQDLPIGAEPVAIDSSTQSQTIVVADQTGAISFIDSQTLAILATMNTKAGLADLRLTPDGRWGFVANPAVEEVIIFDVASRRPLYELPVKGQPDQITFSPTAAYIRIRNQPAVVLVPLADVAAQETISVLTVPMGQVAPSEFAAQAHAISTTPEAGAMVIANPGDDKIYFYQEGSQASMGSFQGHGLRPRAVSVVDRSLREVAPGIYQGSVRVPKRGAYEVAFLLDSPRLVHCFHFEAKANPKLVQTQEDRIPKLEIVPSADQLHVDEPFILQFTLTDPSSGEPFSELADVQVLISQTTSNWKGRGAAKALGEGLYAVTVQVPRPGMYNIFFAIPSLKIKYNQLPNLYLQATTAAASQ